MESKAVFGGGQGKAGEGDNKLNIDSIIARLLEGEKDKDVQSLHPHLILILVIILVSRCLSALA